MAQYQVQVSERVQVQIDVAPGSPALHSVDLNWKARTAAELRDMVDGLGFDAATMDPTKTLFVRHVAVTRDGESVGSAQVNLWIAKELAGRDYAPPTIPALDAIVQEARAKAVGVSG